MHADHINGLFEFCGGLLLWTNVRALYRAKEFKGVAIIPTAFFGAWGVWNLYFYPSLNQWYSFFGGLNIVLANLTWVGQMIYYGSGAKRAQR
jgi:hypothetical protein